jgi:ubiquinone biosynthesis protein
MAPLPRARHAPGYVQIAKLLVKYGRRDLLQSAGLEATWDDEPGAEEAGDPARAEQLTADLEAMGPTYVKLGQLLSSRVDLLAPAYTSALARLQDDVEPFAFSEVEEIVTSELGVRLSRIFTSFDEIPIAAASLGQVHRATLRDGRDVVVKVQRPGVRQQVLEDMEVLASVTEKLDAHTDIGRRFGFADLLEQFRRSLMDELDYRREADNLQTVAQMLTDHPMIVVPSPHLDFTTGRVLTMDYVPGQKITSLGPLARVDQDLEPLADDLFAAYLEQVLVQGTFHADPHPGNVLLTPDGRLVLLDIGMMARLTPATKEKLVKLFLALADARPDEVSRISKTLGQQLPDFDAREFDRAVADIVGRSADASLSEQPIGALVLDLTRQAGECGLKMEPELVMLGKTLLNLDQVATALDPDFEPRDALKRHVADLMKSSMTTSPASLLSSMLEAKEFIEELPGRVNRAFDAVGSGHFELRVNAFDEDEFLRGLHKLANVVATAVILASMILASALLARTSGDDITSGNKIALVVFVLSVVLSLGMLARTVLKSRGVRSHRGD